MPSATPPPTPSVPSPSPTAPGPGEWIEPERIATDYYAEVDLVLDPSGIAHVAAAAYRDGIFYLTNASGSWARERLTSAPAGGYDGEPSIVIGDDGSLAIAFTRFAGLQCSFRCNPVDSQGIFLVTNGAGSWSDAVRIVEGLVQEPSLQTAGGRLHLAYSRGVEVDPRLEEYGDENRMVEYASAADDAGTWTSASVGEGRAPSLQISSDGFARIAYDQNFGPGLSDLHYATQADSGVFVIELVEASGSASEPLLALNAADEPQIVFFNEAADQEDPTCGALSIRQTAGTWSDASVVFEAADDFCTLSAQMVDRDSAGTLHVISHYDVSGAGVWYANDAGGVFRAQHLVETSTGTSDVPNGGSAIAVDDAGRPHIVYVLLEREGELPAEGLWYAIGPAN